MISIHFLILALGWNGGDDLALPREMKLDVSPEAVVKAQEEALEPLTLPESNQEESESAPWIDFEWLEIHPKVGIAIFTDDYHIDPSPFGALQAHVPLPLFSPSSNPGGEYFGVFAEVAFVPSVERDLDPAPSGSKGSLLFISGGIDFTFLRNQSLYLSVHGGAQYGWYGGITDLEDGIASLAGATVGFYAGNGMTVTLGGQSVFAHAGDRIYMGSLGLLIEF